MQTWDDKQLFNNFNNNHGVQTEFMTMNHIQVKSVAGICPPVIVMQFFQLNSYKIHFFRLQLFLMVNAPSIFQLQSLKLRVVLSIRMKKSTGHSKIFHLCHLKSCVSKLIRPWLNPRNIFSIGQHLTHMRAHQTDSEITTIWWRE